MQRVKMATKEALKCVVFLGSVRENNMGSRAAKFISRKLTERGFKVDLLDPEVLDLPLLNKAFHFYQDKSKAPQVLQDTNKKIAEADAFVVVTAEYNHSMPPALTNMMDHFPIASYKYIPSGIVCYSMGSFGGVRASIQARSFLGELGSPNCQSVLAIPTIQKTLLEDGNPVPEDTHLDKGANKLITELEWYAIALKTHKGKNGLPQL